MEITLERRRHFSGFDGEFCKADPRIAANDDIVAMFYSMLKLSGSDVFYDSYAALSYDSGKTFCEPKALTSLNREENGLRSHFLLNNVYYHKHSGKWLILGKLNYYKDEKTPVLINGIAKGTAVYTVFDPQKADWDTNVKELPLPISCITAFPHGQITEYEDGRLAFDFYATTEQDCNHALAIHTEYTFDGETFALCSSSEPLVGVDYARGYFEPSTIYHNGKFYMTLRTDEVGLYSESEDGMHFAAPKIWAWEDGSPIGNKNTMQRFVRVGNTLYLVYTREDKLNGHVFRNRAPLYMTRFDAQKGCLCRDEEIILVPELGARLGNFSVCQVSDNEAWIIVAEWMQYIGCERYGSDNSIWLVKVKAN